MKFHLLFKKKIKDCKEDTNRNLPKTLLNKYKKTISSTFTSASTVIFLSLITSCQIQHPVNVSSETVDSLCAATPKQVSCRPVPRNSLIVQSILIQTADGKSYEIPMNQVNWRKFKDSVNNYVYYHRDYQRFINDIDSFAIDRNKTVWQSILSAINNLSHTMPYHTYGLKKDSFFLDFVKPSVLAIQDESLKPEENKNIWSLKNQIVSAKLLLIDAKLALYDAFHLKSSNFLSLNSTINAFLKAPELLIALCYYSPIFGLPINYLIFRWTYNYISRKRTH